MTGFVVHGHKYFEIYMLCIWFLNKCPSMEKVTTLTSKGQEGHASQPHIDSDLQSQSNQTSLFSTIRAQLMQMSSDRTQQRPMGTQAIRTPTKNSVTSNI